MGLFDKLFGKKKNDDFPPKPSWRPDHPVDIDAILAKAKYYTGEKLQLAVMSMGTVMIFPKHTDDIHKSALENLERIYYAHPDFKPVEMDDGNYLIQYSQPAFTIVFKEEIEKYWTDIDKNHLAAICTSEVLLDAQQRQNVFDRVGKICLYGRAKMFMDAQAPKVVRVFDLS